jgi:hypothetical protein
MPAATRTWMERVEEIRKEEGAKRREKREEKDLQQRSLTSSCT